MFGRRSSQQEVEQPLEAPVPAPSKGRPTPKRRDAQAARKQRMAPPRTRKEASKIQRDRNRQQRLKTREAMDTGDDRYLPARDRGPVKRLIRNYVDSHRTIGEFMVPVFVVVLVTMMIPNPVVVSVASYLWVAVILALCVDAFRMVRGVQPVIRERFGAAEAKGIGIYTVMRSWQMRRLRLPKPQVKPGERY